MPTGALVETPLGGRTVTGVVWDQDPADKPLAFPRSKLKVVGQRLDAPLLPPALRQFIDWTARYVMSPPGAVLRMALPRAALAPPPKRTLYRSPLAGPNPEARMTAARRRAMAELQDTPALPAMEAARVANVSPAVVKGMAAAGLLEAVTIVGDAPMPVLDPEGRKPSLGVAQAEAVQALEASVRARRSLSRCWTVSPGQAKRSLYGGNSGGFGGRSPSALPVARNRTDGPMA